MLRDSVLSNQSRLNYLPLEVVNNNFTRNLIKFKCFIIDRELRGVSCSFTQFDYTNSLKQTIVSAISYLINQVKYYNDFTVDIAVNLLNNHVSLLEIKYQDYEFEDSFNFTINEIILLLLKKNNGVSYPIFK